MRTVVHDGMSHPLLGGMTGGPRKEAAPAGSAAGSADGAFSAVLTRAVRAAKRAAAVERNPSRTETRPHAAPSPAKEEQALGSDGTGGAAAWTAVASVETPVARGGEGSMMPVRELGRNGLHDAAGGHTSSATSGSAEGMGSVPGDAAAHGTIRRMGTGNGGVASAGPAVAAESPEVPVQAGTAVLPGPQGSGVVPGVGKGPGHTRSVGQFASPYPLGPWPTGTRSQARGKLPAVAAVEPGKGQEGAVSVPVSHRSAGVLTLERGALRAVSRRGAGRSGVAGLDQEGAAVSPAPGGVQQRGVGRYAASARGFRDAGAARHDGWKMLDEGVLAGRLSGGDGTAPARVVSDGGAGSAGAHGPLADGVAGGLTGADAPDAARSVSGGASAEAAGPGVGDAGASGMASEGEAGFAGSQWVTSSGSQAITDGHGRGVEGGLSARGEPVLDGAGPLGGDGRLADGLRLSSREVSEFLSRSGYRAGGLQAAEAGEGPAGSGLLSDGASGLAPGASEARGWNVTTPWLSAAPLEGGELARAGGEGGPWSAAGPEWADTGMRMAADIVRLAAPVRGGGAQEALLQLYPEELGRLVVRVSVENERVQLHMKAQDASVRALLESHLPLLRHALGEQGLRLEHVRIDVPSGAESGASGAYDGDRGAAGAAAHGFGGDGHHAGRGGAPQGPVPVAAGETAAESGDEAHEGTPQWSGRGVHRIDVRA